MPALKTNRCICHRCWKITDPYTGERGVVLDASTFRKHLMESRRMDLEASALNAQKTTLEAHEDALEEAMKLLSVKDSQAPSQDTIVARERIYMIERKRQMAEQLGIILDDIRTREKIIESLDHTADQYADMAIEDAIQTCRDVRGLNSSAARELGISNSGPTRRQASIKQLRHDAFENLKRLDTRVKTIEAVWERRLIERNRENDKVKNSVPTFYNTAHHFQTMPHNDWLKQEFVEIMEVLNFMVVVSQVILGFSRRGCHFLYQMCEFIAQKLAEALLGLEWNKWDRSTRIILSEWPQDVRAVTSRFNLEAKYVVYAACPSCNEIHKPALVDQIPTYPERCNARKYGNRCGELLVRPKRSRNRSISVPIKPYLAFDFQDWLSGILSRQGYEKQMDDAWKWTNMPPSLDGSIKDIFQSSRIRNFKGRDGKHFSKSGEGDAGRYLFSLGFDFFNPLRNLTAGKKISIGVIALTCLNLPIDLRYKPENLFLAGIIPGPKEPALDAANPYFRPIVDAFLIFWVGVFFTKTALYEKGR